MLRPAIIASIKERPNKQHIIHTLANPAPLYSDIDNLEIVVIDGDNYIECLENSSKLYHEYDNCIVYKLSSPCYDYEVENSPNIYRSRQEMFCAVIGVKFSIDNYNVKFTQQERDTARKFIKSGYKNIGIHLRAMQDYRSYRYTTKAVKLVDDNIKYRSFVEHIARRFSGYVYIFDLNYKYDGKLDNIVNVNFGDVRLVWAIMSLMDIGIGVDSFGIHAMGSVGVPVYGIFGATDPKCRLLYKTSYTSPLFDKCSRQHCWYQPCKYVPCINARYPSFYWNDIESKMGHYLYDKPIGKSEPVYKSLLKTKSSNIAIVLLEGMGGTITITDHAKKVYELTGKKVDIVVRGYESLFIDNPHIDQVINVGNAIPVDKGLKSIADSYDIAALIKTGIGKWSNNNIIKQDFTEWEDRYNYHPLKLNELEKYNLNLVQMVDMTLGLPYDTIDTEIYHTKKWEPKLPYQYILVANGVDTLHGGKLQTKSWPYKKWCDFVANANYPVVQVGTKFDKSIRGVKQNLLGKTTIPELLNIIQRAKAVVCIEGGIMHLAYALHHSNVFVLRGPTCGSFYGYPGMTMIDAKVDCAGCYWSTMSWSSICPQNVDAECMKRIDPFNVAELVNISMGLL